MSSRKGEVGSIHDGTLVRPPNIDYKVWLQNNQGYIYGGNLKNMEIHQLASDYIKEKNFLPPSQYAHEHDCYYLQNNCHIETRGGHRYLRPSNCSKFVLQRGLERFTDYEWAYAYHGADPKNVQSILKHGLKPAGAVLPGGAKVNMVHGTYFGSGVYTSKLPIYAQLYAKPEKWRGKWVQTIFLLRQNVDSITVHGTEGCATAGMLGRSDVHNLYGGLIGENEVQFLTTTPDGNICIQALLVKIHETPPTADGGEYAEMLSLLQTITEN